MPIFLTSKEFSARKTETIFQYFFDFHSFQFFCVSIGIHTFRPSHVSPLSNLVAHFAPHKLLAHFAHKMYIKKAALINCVIS